jgi:site-specific DNA-methyltransferase (adenine-specific)
MEYMRGLPDKAFDLAIVDPPYGIGAGEMNMGLGTSAACSKAKNRRWIPKAWDDDAPSQQYFEELRRVSNEQIIWGGNHFRLEPSRGWIVWDKEVPDGLSFSDFEVAWTSFDRAARMVRQSVYSEKADKIHPTQKPVALYRWLLKNYAKPGQRILDTHGGSMSIAIACDIEGFDLTLCELDKDYFEAGKKRLEQHQAQPRLFDAPPTTEHPKQNSLL